MRVLFSALFLLVAATAVARPSHACAPAPPEGAFVDIVSEEALIVFDAAKRQEHFVRRASFHADSKDFGFLVPTPSKPELAEADDAIFDRLRRAIAPEIIRRKERHLALGACATMFLAGDKAAAPFEAASAVEVLGRERVAGLDAAILAAKDSDALGRWLDDHGYHFRPELRDWLQAYLDRDYIITAFKIAGDDPRKHATKALRMSFASERPFYPYREPSDQRTKLAAFYQGDPLGPPKRTLRVYLLSAGRWEGALEGGLAWPAEAEYAAPPKKGLDLGPSLPASLLPAGAWLHAFIDRSSPRPGTADLLFAEAKDQEPVVPPPMVVVDEQQVLVPLDLLLIVGVVGVLVWRVVRRRRARA